MTMINKRDWSLVTSHWSSLVSNKSLVITSYWSPLDSLLITQCQAAAGGVDPLVMADFEGFLLQPTAPPLQAADGRQLPDEQEMGDNAAEPAAA